MPNFIEINRNITTNVLGGLPRDMVLVTREAVVGFTPDPESGLIQINESDVTSFNTQNPTKYGLVNALSVAFAQNNAPDLVYILSATSGVTSALLDQANLQPRQWSFLTLVSQLQGQGADEANYFTDLNVISLWLPANSDKICCHTYSTEESGGSITLPADLIAPAGAIVANNQIKTIVSNSKTNIDPYTIAYNNIAIAWMAFNLYGSAVSRSWGSLSDSRDYQIVASDTYPSSVRSQIINGNLGQYNGAKDRGGSLFVYDTLMNDGDTPPGSLQIETIAAINYIEDFTYVSVRNSLQAAGSLGLTNDDPGIQKLTGLVIAALNDTFDLNLILATESGSADFSVKSLTATQVTQLSADWQTTGVWPSGVIVARVRPFGAAHYIEINFNF